MSNSDYLDRHQHERNVSFFITTDLILSLRLGTQEVIQTPQCCYVLNNYKTYNDTNTHVACTYASTTSNEFTYIHHSHP